MINLVRKPAVSGKFYSNDPLELRKQLGSFINKNKLENKINAIGCLVPHAGYIYSGEVAASVFSKIDLKENFIILGPNHTGYGQLLSIMTEGCWETPLGKVQVNSDLAKEFLKNSVNLKEDFLAHKYEHSLEVQLPFLQYFKDNFKIIPIVVGIQDFSIYKKLGKEIAKVLKDLNLIKDTIIVASSDMTHYESDEIARSKDEVAIDAVLKLDEDLLYRKIRELDITMCGYAPAIVMLSAVKELGAKKAELIKYETSGKTSGDYNAVVGYAGIIIN
ncbi:MAG: AmmeMemoRadiSam system protein B [Candidatus Omnitrophota bacterium]